MTTRKFCIDTHPVNSKFIFTYLQSQTFYLLWISTSQKSITKFPVILRNNPSRKWKIDYFLAVSRFSNDLTIH